MIGDGVSSISSSVVHFSSLTDFIFRTPLQICQRNSSESTVDLSSTCTFTTGSCIYAPHKLLDIVLIYFGMNIALRAAAANKYVEGSPSMLHVSLTGALRPQARDTASEPPSRISGLDRGHGLWLCR
jgi:hypothetical protein